MSALKRLASGLQLPPGHHVFKQLQKDLKVTSRVNKPGCQARPTSAPAGDCSAKRGQNSKSMENCSCLGMPALFAVANAGMGELSGP